MKIVLRSRRGWPRLSIADVMTAIAAIALAMVWPPASLLVCGGLLIVLLYRSGFTPLAIVMIVVVLGFVLGLVAGSGWLL